MQQYNQIQSAPNMNYWKEIDHEIPEILQNLKGIILLTHNSIEFSHIIDVLNTTKKDHFTNVLYISLIRSYNYMKTSLDQKPLDQKKIFFIDCVSGFAFPSEDTVDNCLYHKPPCNLQEMKDILTFGINKAGPDIIVIDSLSQFINFSKPTDTELEDLYTFLRLIREDTLNINQNTFLLLYDYKMGVMQKLPKTSIDMILRLELVKENSSWKF